MIMDSQEMTKETYKMINCLIVDDEPLAQEILAEYVNHSGRLNLAAKCSTASNAFEVLNQTKIELLFLDIKMPSVNGLDFIRSLKNPPAVIFTTAFSEYAAESYDLDAVDYLLKPITYNRFNKSLDKFFKLQPINLVDEKNYTYFKISGKLIKLMHNDILYVQSIKDYLLIHTINDNNVIVHMTMKYLVELLPAASFSRIHRSYMVNNTHIRLISRNYINIAGEEIPVGESYRAEVGNLKNSL